MMLQLTNLVALATLALAAVAPTQTLPPLTVLLGTDAAEAFALHPVPGADPTARYRGDLLAQLDLAGGNRALFLEPEPGELLVVASGVGAKPEWLDRHRSGELSATELYQHLTGKPAPATLRAAQQRGELAASQGQEATEPDAARAEPGDSTATAPAGACNSVAWFQGNHCGPAGFSYCWVNLTGNPWVQRHCWGMWAVTACVSGSYVFEFRYKSAGSWKTSFSTTVLTCQWYYASGGYTWRDRRAHVLNGTGDLKHFSVRGED